jgi:hypothetical protein
MSYANAHLCVHYEFLSPYVLVHFPVGGFPGRLGCARKAGGKGCKGKMCRRPPRTPAQAQALELGKAALEALVPACYRAACNPILVQAAPAVQHGWEPVRPVSLVAVFRQAGERLVRRLHGGWMSPENNQINRLSYLAHSQYNNP